MSSPYAIVYQATNSVNGKRYIGFTARGLRAREKAHRALANTGGGNLLQAAMRKHGHANIVFEVLADFDGDEDLAKLYECEAIAKYRPEYNLTYGGEGGTLAAESRKKIGDANRGRKMPPSHKEKRIAFLTGRKASAETRAKMSVSGMGRVSHTRGVPLSEETKAKISAANKDQVPWTQGKKHSEETRAKISAWQIGRKMSGEARANMSAARKKAFENPTPAMIEAHKKLNAFVRARVNPKSKAVRCATDGKFFVSGLAADKHYGFKHGTVSRVISGEKKQAPWGVFEAYKGLVL